MTKILNIGDQLTSQPCVATIGSFDGVHLGHRHLIECVKKQAQLQGMASAVVTFTCHPLQVLAPHAPLELLMTTEQRLEALSQLGVDTIFLTPFTPALAALTARDFATLLQRQCGVNTLVLGFNHRFGSDHGASLRHDDATLPVVTASEYAGSEAPVSSSIVRRLLHDGRVAQAAAKLGHPHELRGTVVHGHHNGTAMGFPTANVQPPPHCLVPAVGAYAVLVTVRGATLRGMAGVGYRPTVDGHNRHLTVEVNIFDHEGDLYGSTLGIHFVERLRDEERWSGVDALRRQLATDRRRALAILNEYSQHHSPLISLEHYDGSNQFV